MTLFHLKNINTNDFQKEINEFFECYDVITQFEGNKINFDSKLKISENYTGVCRLVDQESSVLCDITFDKTKIRRRVFLTSTILLVLSAILGIVNFVIWIGGHGDEQFRLVFNIYSGIFIILSIVVVLGLILSTLYQPLRDEKKFLSNFEKWFQDYL